jgi:hypothetical protein
MTGTWSERTREVTAMGSVVIGELQAVADVGWLWAEAEESRRKERRRSEEPKRAEDGSGFRLRSAKSGKVTGKRLGERAEAEFLAKAAGMGFGVAKPWGDSDRYDFILDVSQVCREERSGLRQEASARKGRSRTPGKHLTLWRVQVKSAHRLGEDGMYSFRMHGHSGEAYGADEIDAMVAYVAPEKAWYVLPAAVFQKVRSLKLFPGSRRKRSRFEQYREAWELLL